MTLVSWRCKYSKFRLVFIQFKFVQEHPVLDFSQTIHHSPFQSNNSLSKSCPLCMPTTFGSKLLESRHSRSGARGRYNMHVTKAQVLDLGLCYIHTRFHSFILGTSGENSGLSFILKMGPCISNIFPCLTQFGQKLDLGPCYIQVFNY